MNKSFEVMLEKLSPTLRRISYKLNGHFSFFDEDDLFHEAIIHLWIAFRDGKLGDKTDSYVLQGCYFHLKNYIRKTLDRAKLISLSQLIDEEDSTIEEMLAVDDCNIRNSAEGAILADKIMGGCLTERERQVVTLSLEGLTTREIGKRLGISHVMVTKLRKKIKDGCAGLKDKYLGGYQN